MKLPPIVLASRRTQVSGVVGRAATALVLALTISLLTAGPLSTVGAFDAYSGSAQLVEYQVPSPISVTVPLTSTPRQLAPVDLDRLRRQTAAVNLLGPRRQSGTSQAPTTSSAVPESLANESAAAAPTLQIAQQTSLLSIIPTGLSSEVNEPSVTITGDGSHVFETGNWYAALSSDGGETFSHINPITAFPSVNGGFCCDQGTVYAVKHDLVVWEIMYQYDSLGNNTVRLAVAAGPTKLDSGTWTYYDLTPQMFGIASGHWFDYPTYLSPTTTFTLRPTFSTEVAFG